MYSRFNYSAKYRNNKGNKNMKILKYTVLTVAAVLGWAYVMPEYFPFEMLIKTFYWFL
jgi:hypothetical protein